MSLSKYCPESNYTLRVQSSKVEYIGSTKGSNGYLTNPSTSNSLTLKQCGERNRYCMRVYYAKRSSLLSEAPIHCHYKHGCTMTNIERCSFFFGSQHNSSYTLQGTQDEIVFS